MANKELIIFSAVCASIIMCFFKHIFLHTMDWGEIRPKNKEKDITNVTLELKLKTMDWSDRWVDFIVYRSPVPPTNGKFSELYTPCTTIVLETMKQLENMMTVYDAYLKGIEQYLRICDFTKAEYLRFCKKLQKSIYEDVRCGKKVNDLRIDVLNIVIKVAPYKIK